MPMANSDRAGCWLSCKAAGVADFLPNCRTGCALLVIAVEGYWNASMMPIA